MKDRQAYALFILTLLVSCLASSRQASTTPIPSDYQVLSLPLDIRPGHCWANAATNRVYAWGLLLGGTDWRVYSVDADALTVTGEVAVPSNSWWEPRYSARHNVIIAFVELGWGDDRIVVLDADTEELAAEHPLEDGEMYGGSAFFDDIDRLLVTMWTRDADMLVHYDLGVFSAPSMYLRSGRYAGSALRTIMRSWRLTKGGTECSTSTAVAKPTYPRTSRWTSLTPRG